MRRIATLIGLLVAIGATASPAAGALQSTSARLIGISHGATIEGAVTLRGKGSAAAGVKRIEILIEGTRVAINEPNDLRNEAEIRYRWDTRLSPGGVGQAPNGRYRVVVSVTGNAGGTDRVSAQVAVNNPPVEVTGLKATVSSSDVTLSWTPNPEPDISAYRVERDSGAGFTAIGETAQTSYVDRPPSGSHAYRIVAVRASPVASGGRASTPSASVHATVTAPSPAPGSDKNSASRKESVGSEKSRRRADDGGAPGGGLSTKNGVAAFGPRGLPNAAALPGFRGLPPPTRLPESSNSIEWDTYDETLPYDLSQPAGDIWSPPNVAAKSTSTVIPPDGLRWVAAGTWLLAVAGLLILLASRLTEAQSAKSGGEKTEVASHRPADPISDNRTITIRRILVAFARSYRAISTRSRD